MLRALGDPSFTVFVVSFSPQSLASLASHYGIDDTLVAYRKLAAYFRSLGFHYVIDTTVGGELALAEECAEFVARLRRQRAKGDRATRKMAAAPPASVALSSTELRPVSDTVNGVAVAAGDAVTAENWDAGAGAPCDDGPLLASACPGWVCYAEKTVPESLPNLSRVRSPQQSTGAVVKQLLTGGSLARPGGGPLSAAAIYHVTVMPCYDKKLEASRRDFWWEASDAKEVDCVLTSGEVVDLLTAGGVNLEDVIGEPRVGLYAPMGTDEPSSAAAVEPTPSDASARPIKLEQLLTGVTRDGASLVGPVAENVSSDAHLETVLRAAAQELHGVDDKNIVVECETPVRNPDFREMCIRDAGGAILVRGALAYGFRNIQTVIARMRRGRAMWDYVEVMACPSGCANGGGQVKPRDDAVVAAARNASSADALPTAVHEAVDASVSRIADVVARLRSRVIVRPGSSPAVAALLDALAACGAAEREVGRVGGAASTLLRTRYHHVPKLETAAMKW